MDSLERDPRVQPCPPTELMVVNAGNAPIKKVVLLNKFVVHLSIAEQEIQCVGNAHRNCWGEALKRGNMETMRLSTEIWEAPDDCPCVP